MFKEDNIKKYIYNNTIELTYNNETEYMPIEEFARWCSNHNCKWNDSNFFVGKDVTTLSNCCRLLSDTNELNPLNAPLPIDSTESGTTTSVIKAIPLNA